MLALLLTWACASETQRESDTAEHPEVTCPANLPDGLPEGFASFIDVANVIHVQVRDNKIGSIGETLRKHKLWPRGRLVQIRLDFHPGGEIHLVTITVHDSDQMSVLAMSCGRTRFYRLWQSGMFWDGTCEVELQDGRITAYREADIDWVNTLPVSKFDYIGLQVEWSSEGEIVSKTVLETPQPFVLSVGDTDAESIKPPAPK